MNIVIATIKSWNIINVNKMCIPGVDITLIDDKDKLSFEVLRALEPKYVFFIHWSWYIPDDIFTNFECMVFHPTRVPFGRGGSPIQNLVAMGIKETTISAIKICSQLDAGPVYLRRDGLSLEGTADEILIRMSRIVCFEMIPEIIRKRPVPVEQEGEVVLFSRRKPANSKIDFEQNLDKIFDLIRMVDGEGYPRAYVDIGHYRIIFSRASLHTNSIEADVVIEERSDDE